MKIFIIRPVRNITPEFSEGIQAEIDALEKQGHIVYDPARDTDQGGNSLAICSANLEAIKAADEIHFCWDGESQGCLFDLGIAFSLGKIIHPIVGRVPRMTIHKSFQNMVYQYEDAKE